MTSRILNLAYVPLNYCFRRLFMLKDRTARRERKTQFEISNAEN
jgi:hypothetical protein